MRAGPEAANLLVLHPLPHLEGGEADHVGDVPDLAGLVPAGGEKLLTRTVPGQPIHSAGVPAQLALGFAVLAVIQEDLAVEAAAGPEVAVGRVANHLAVPGVVRLGALELEGRSLVDCSRVVLAACDDPEGPGRLEVDRVNWPGLAGDVTVTRARVGQEHVTKLLPTLAHYHDTLVVTEERV